MIPAAVVFILADDVFAVRKMMVDEGAELNAVDHRQHSAVFVFCGHLQFIHATVRASLLLVKRYRTVFMVACAAGLQQARGRLNA